MNWRTGPLDPQQAELLARAVAFDRKLWRDLSRPARRLCRLMVAFIREVGRFPAAGELAPLAVFDQPPIAATMAELESGLRAARSHDPDTLMAVDFFANYRTQWRLEIEGKGVLHAI